MDWTDVSWRNSIKSPGSDQKSILGNEKNFDRLPTLLNSSNDYSEKMVQLRIDKLQDIKNGIDQILKSLSVNNIAMDP